MERLALISESCFRLIQKRIVAAALLFAAFVAAQTPPAPHGDTQQTTFVLEGRVTEYGTGKGILGATILAVDSHKKSYPTLSMADGTYRLEHLPREAKLSLSCSMLGYSPNPRQAAVELKSGVGRWDPRLFNENGDTAYLKTVADHLKLIQDSAQRLEEAKFVADNTDDKGKDVIAAELHESSQERNGIGGFVGFEHTHHGSGDPAAQAAPDRAVLALFDTARLKDPTGRYAEYQAETNTLQIEASWKNALAAQRMSEQSATAYDAHRNERLRREFEDQIGNSPNQAAMAARERLKKELNTVLQTNETAQGLTVAVPDVLFTPNHDTLKPEARIKLAKVSGILMDYPGLKLQVLGYVPDTDANQFTLKLSQSRTSAIRNYLVSQGVDSRYTLQTEIEQEAPAADNSTATGRATKRMVELVISGKPIGIDRPEAEKPAGAASPPPQ